MWSAIRTSIFLLLVLLAWTPCRFAIGQTIYNLSVFLDGSKGIAGPTGIALDANSNIYIYEDVPIPAVIQKFSPTGSFLGAVPEPERSIAVGEGHLTRDPRP